MSPSWKPGKGALNVQFRTGTLVKAYTSYKTLDSYDLSTKGTVTQMMQNSLDTAENQSSITHIHPLGFRLGSA